MATISCFQMHKGMFIKRDMQYVYEDGDGYVFIDADDFNSFTLPRQRVGALISYLKEGASAVVLLHDGEPVGLELPPRVDLAIADAEPAGAAPSKCATLETGLKVNVPSFLNIGDLIRIDTRTGDYLGRATSPAADRVS